VTAIALSDELPSPGQMQAGPAWHKRLVGGLLATILGDDLRVIEAGETVAVERLREAESPEDVRVIIDELRDSDAARAAVTAWKGLGASWPLRVVVAALPKDEQSVWSPLGGVVARYIGLGVLYGSEAWRIGRAGGVKPKPSDGLLDRAIYDVTLPLEFGEAALGVLRAPYCLLALSGAMHRPLPQWITRAVATTFADGMFAALRLVAACHPDIEPNATILPPEDRLDLEALRKKTDDQVAAWDALPVSREDVVSPG
jgi:hypothetical protein